MKQKPRMPPIPRMAEATTRHAVMELLLHEELSAREISEEVRIAEKEVYAHLEHVRRSIENAEGSLEVTPAECRSCGFVFRKRDRLTTPGKCPVCRSEAISDPRFRIRGVI